VIGGVEPVPLPPSTLTLFVTDLVFSNPSDTAVGTLTLARRDLRDPNNPTDQPLLVLQVQNFRDIDFHWVTQLTFGPGFGMYLSCSGSCDAQTAVSWSGFQR